MYNLAEFKSRQLHRHSSIEPIVRIPSFNEFSNNKKQISNLIFQKYPYAENHYNLASIVNDILDLKPKTASKRISQPNLKNNKTQLNAVDKKSKQFYTNNDRSDKHLGLINNNEQNEQAFFKSKQPCILNKHYKLSYTDQQKGLLRQSNKKTITEQKYQSNTIKEVKDLFVKKETIQEDRLVQIVDKKTRNNQYTLLPKAKLSVRTIDPIINPKSQSITNQFNKKIKSDIQINESQNKTHPKATILQSQSSLDKKLYKIKRSVTDIKVPDFIKMSLQGYCQPEFRIKTVLHKPEEAQQIKNQPQSQINQNIIEQTQEKTNNRSYQNLAGIKLKLQLKQKRKLIKTSENQREDKQGQALIDRQQFLSKYKTKKSVCSRKKVMLQEMEHDICGWESNEPHFIDTIKLSK